MTLNKSIQDLDVQILTLLYQREHKNFEGAGTYIIQKCINSANSRNKHSHNVFMEHLYKLQREGFIQYKSDTFWGLTKQGREICQDFEDEIGSKYYSLMVKLYN